MAERGDWYDYPLWYDILHAPGTGAEVAGLWRLARRFVAERHGGRRRDRAPTWLEPACGSGRYLIAAAARYGVRGIGIDLNQRMVAYARQRARELPEGAGRPRFRVNDMARFEVSARDRADLAFCLINSSRHLANDDAMTAHLRCVRRALRPGGVYVVGLSLTCHASEFATEDVWVGTRGGVRVHQLVQYLPPGVDRSGRQARRERVVSHLTITSRKDERHLDSSYWLRSYTGSQWSGVIGRAGMECIGIVDERGDDLPGTRSDGTRLVANGRWFGDEAEGYALFVLRECARSAHLSGSPRVAGRSRR